MELDLMKLQTMWNDAAKSVTMSASEKFVIYEYVSRQLEQTLTATRRTAGMVLERAVMNMEG